MLMLKIIRKFLGNRILRLKPHTSASGQYSYREISSSQRQPQESGDGDSSGGGKWIAALGTIMLATGATLAYAKYDPNFRKKLGEHIPLTEPLLQTLDEASVSKAYSNTKQTLIRFIGGENKEADVLLLDKPSELVQLTEYKAPDPIVPALADELGKPQERYDEIRFEQRDGGESEFTVEIIGGAKPPASETDTENLADLEQQIYNLATEAVNAYNDVIRILSSYNRDIEYIIDESIHDVKTEIWDNIGRKTKAKNECVRRAQEKAEEAIGNVKRLKELISQTGSENSKVIIDNKMSKIHDDIEKAKSDMETEIKRSNVTEKYWDKVQKARKRFSEELETLFPNVDLRKKILTLNQEDLDLFILHVYSNVLFYQKELAKMETLLQFKIDNAVEAARKGHYEPLSMAQICEAIEQEKRRLTECFQQHILRLKKESESELKAQLNQQSQTFNEKLTEAITLREKEIEEMLTVKFNEELEKERCGFKIQLATIAGKLRGLDDAIKARNEAQETSKQAQVLWSACQSLLRAMRVGCPGIPWKDQIRPLEPEINAVLKAAAPNDEMVCVVIEQIPKEAKNRGVYPEDALRERFLEVARAAENVALVPAEGAALPIHILSFIESLLLYKSANTISRAELNDEYVDFSKLNTHDILQRARFWLDRGDLSQTLRYMNLLQGAPRCVASQWMNEARILLETQQAANTLTAYAFSSGLPYL